LAYHQARRPFRSTIVYLAKTLNYHATKQKVTNLESREIAQLDEQLMLETIDSKEYVSEKRKVESKYSAY
jgi:hypothetical protein